MSFQGKTCWGVSNRRRSVDGEQELRQSGRCGIITNKIPAVFVLRKNGRKMKKRTKEEEMRKVIRGFPHQMRKVIRGFPTQKVRNILLDLDQKRFQVTLQARVNRVSFIHHRKYLVLGGTEEEH